MKLIIANWKRHPDTIRDAVKLAEATDQSGLVICPPDKFVAGVAPVIKKGKLGAQDLFWKKAPPVKVEYAIVGHSDRRYGLGESDATVARKFTTAIKQGIIPILCVGETLEQKRSDEKEKIIEREITTAFHNLQPTTYNLQPIYVAYEPIWAISTSPNAEPDNPENTLETIKFIKEILRNINEKLLNRVHFIYGGSINVRNVGKFLKHSEIEGALVGGASLIPDQINEVVKIAGRHQLSTST